MFFPMVAGVGAGWEYLCAVVVGGADPPLPSASPPARGGEGNGGEIPAPGAGMTELGGAGMTEEGGCPNESGTGRC